MKMAGMATALLLAGFGAQAATGEAQSVYTEISDKACAVIPATGEPGDEEDGLRCPGPAGYQLLALSGDLRATVTVIAPEGTEQTLKYWDVITHSFSSLGPRAEWRVRDVNGQTVPHALIVRVIANEDPDNPEHKTSYLAVAKITPELSCVTDRIEGGPDDNARARIAADAAASKPCLGNREP